MEKVRLDSAWTVEETAFNPRFLAKGESTLAQGNGYMNLRCAQEESYVGQRRGAFITGTFNKALPDEVTELPNLPDVTELFLAVNGERFAMDRGEWSDYSRALDLRTGEVVRRMRWTSPGGDAVELRFRRFVSLTEEHLAAFSMELTALSGPVELHMESGINSRASNTGSQHCAEGEKRLLGGEILRLCTRTGQSGIPVSVHCVHRFNLPPARSLPVMERRRFVNRYFFRLEKGETLRMEKFACYHTGRDLAFAAEERPGGTEDMRPVSAAGDKCIQSASGKGYRALLSESAALWGKYWAENDVEIESDEPFDQLAMRFALYHLNIMIKRDDSRVGIGAKGMTGEGYKGHSFWDTEMFLLPHYLFTDPASARTLLEYRARSLPGAWRKAAENGYEGAMFPWESAWLDDGEVTPRFGAADVETGDSIPILTGILEHHITADIAWAVRLYYTATGDDDFMSRCGCELLIETARFWASRLEWNDAAGRYEIRDVIGPDEYKEHVDNNAFTNYMAAWNLSHAAETALDMERRWPDAYGRLSKKYDLSALAAEFAEKRAALYLPSPRADGIVPQNDQYLGLERIDLSKYKCQQGVSTIYEDYSQAQMNRIMVSKQADLVMLLRIMPELFPPEIRRRNFLFYESRTLHDSSLSHGQHCILAAWLALNDMALDLYRHACEVDLGPNPASSDEGIHSASMGNLWQCVVCGFAGLQWHEGPLSLRSHLPESWRRLSFRMVWRGARLHVELTPGYLEVRNLSGPAVTLRLERETHSISAGESVRVHSDGGAEE